MSLYLSLEEQSEYANFVGSYLKEVCRILAPCWIWILFNFQLEHVCFRIFYMLHVMIVLTGSLRCSLVTVPDFGHLRCQKLTTFNHLGPASVCVCESSVSVCVCVCVWIQQTHAVVAILGNEDNFFTFNPNNNWGVVTILEKSGKYTMRSLYKRIDHWRCDWYKNDADLEMQHTIKSQNLSLDGIPW
jgi:hypothetical protein